MTTTSARSLRSQHGVDRAARTPARIAIVVVLAALASLVSIAAAHASPAGTETTASTVHAATPAHPVIGSVVGGGWPSVVVQLVLWSIVVGLVVTRRRRTSAQPVE